MTEEQESLVDKLVLDDKLRENYKRYGLCKQCKLKIIIFGVDYVISTKFQKLELRRWWVYSKNTIKSCYIK